MELETATQTQPPKLHLLRKKSGATQKEVARELGLSPTVLGRREKETNSPDFILRYSEACKRIGDQKRNQKAAIAAEAQSDFLRIAGAIGTDAG